VTISCSISIIIYLPHYIEYCLILSYCSLVINTTFCFCVYLLSTLNCFHEFQIYVDFVFFHFHFLYVWVFILMNILLDYVMLKSLIASVDITIPDSKCNNVQMQFLDIFDLYLFVSILCINIQCHLVTLCIDYIYECYYPFSC
jgi:hypothetical protein